MSAAPLTATTALRTRGLSKRFDGVVALDSFDLEVARGEIVALIGPNGAGKTTLFNVLTGFLRADAGGFELGGRRFTRTVPHQLLRHGVARTFQDLRLIGGLSALDNVLLACPHQRGESLWRLAAAPRAIAAQEREGRELAHQLLGRVGLEAKAGDLARQLSYGQQKLLTMACALATGAGLLLLDEPVAGVHPRIIERILALVRELAAEGRTAVLIEHNVEAVRRVAGRLVFMDQGRKVAEGAPEQVLSDERVLEAYLK